MGVFVEYEVFFLDLKKKSLGIVEKISFIVKT